MRLQNMHVAMDMNQTIRHLVWIAAISVSINIGLVVGVVAAITKH